MIQSVERSEAAEYYFTYIDQVALAPGEDICDRLASQTDEVLKVFGSISEDRSLHRYAPDKWSLREVLGHINDAERVFTFRALWFARGFDSPLPSFDQGPAVAAAGAHARSWSSLVDEFRSIRAASLALFRSLPAEAWARSGVASGSPVTVRALAFITAGHVAHHVRILRERYL
jgi:hypothetical protein